LVLHDGHLNLLNGPDLDDPNQSVSFGTSGHRGSPFAGSFTDD
jgi:phosphoglucomutase